MSIFVEQKCVIRFCLKKKSSAFHTVQYAYKISAGLDTAIFRGRGEGAGFKHGFILILAVHPIPFQLLLVLSSFSVFSGTKTRYMQTHHCTSKLFYLLTKTMHLLRKYNKLLPSQHYAEIRTAEWVRFPG